MIWPEPDVPWLRLTRKPDPHALCDEGNKLGGIQSAIFPREIDHNVSAGPEAGHTSGRPLRIPEARRMMAQSKLRMGGLQLRTSINIVWAEKSTVGLVGCE